MSSGVIWELKYCLDTVSLSSFISTTHDYRYMDAPSDLYLDLLKRSITNTVFEQEPDIDDEEFRFTLKRVEHYVDTGAVSMIPLGRFDNMQNCITDILRDGVDGDLIETGAWRGGATIFMRGVLKAYGVTDRLVWVADSFEGLPKPDPVRFPLEARIHKGAIIQGGFRNFAAGLDEVRRNFAA